MLTTAIEGGETRSHIVNETVSTTTTATNKKPEAFHIPSLDGIRALSFLLVFVSHAGLGHIIPGGFGVTIFFFLSGYLITTLLRMEYEKTQTIDFRAFYLRRTLRIFPPFYVVLIVASLLTWAGILQGSLSLSAVLAQFAYLSNYFVIFNGFDGAAPGTGIFWSLAVEEHFYLVFPLLYFVLQRNLPARFHQMLVLSGICIAILIWRCILVYGLGSPDIRTYIATDTRIDSILIGCILAIYANPVLDQTRITQRVWLFVLAPLGVLALAGSLLYRDPLYRETFRYTIQGLALLPLFIVAIRFHHLPMIRWLNLRWVRFVGLLSYSLYLVHLIYLSALTQFTFIHPILQGIIGLVVSLLTATAIHYLIERPSTQIRRQLLANA
jgi:peptidoglycan/LPS O-acetylase OafA/YrhL